uniref:Uncharacterized protein n=1 Tax=Globodera rostochiensis TaxID=31243 RepID=A0A914H1W0_GLORO
MERIALCVGMEKEMCYMMYGDKLADSVEMREIFEGVKVGQWFRVSTDRRKGRQSFESVEATEAPSTRVIQSDGKNVLQVQLPIFFLPCKNDGRSRSVAFYDSGDILIKPLVQYEAFLTLTEWNIGVPRWNLQSLKNIVVASTEFNTNESAQPLHCANQKEAGFVLKLFDDVRLVLILCLQDGQLAIAAAEAVQRYSAGDYVSFLCREVERPVQPSIISSNLFAFGLSLRNAVDFSARTTLSFPLRSLDEDKLFELRFRVTDPMLSSTIRGSIRVENLGVLLDTDEKLASNMSSYRLNQLVILQARLCLVPERQSPLWFIVKVISEEEAEEIVKVTNEQSYDFNSIDNDDERSDEILNQNMENEIEPEDENHELMDGGFGSCLPERKRVNCDTKRLEGNCVEESLHASIGESSVSSSESIRGGAENLPLSDGTALFVQIKSYEWILALFDQQTKKFTHWCCTLIKSLPLDREQRSPIPGSWFQISNRELWTMIIQGKFDRISASRGGTLINLPIPVTNVFSRAKSEAQMDNKNNNRSVLSPCPSNAFSNGSIYKKTRIFSQKDNNMMNKTRLERYFCVELELAGIVIGCLHASDRVNDDEHQAKNTYRIWPFCTGKPTPRELTLNTSQALQLGTWVKFDAECYRRGKIENFNELSHWLETSVSEGSKASKVCLECSIQIASNYDPSSEENNEIWTCRFKPKNPHIPFIKKLVPTNEIIKSHLEKLRGKFGVFARLEYGREFGINGETVGYWRIAELLTGVNM